VSPDPVTATIIAAIVAGAGTASTLGFQAANQPGTPNAAKQLKEQTPGAVAQLTQERQLEGSQAAQTLPGLQENTLGGVSPAYLQEMSATLSGNANLLGTSELSGVVNNFLGLPSGVASGGAGGGAGSPNPLSTIFPGLTNTGSTPGLAAGPGLSGATNSWLGGTGTGSTNNPYATLLYGS